MEKIAPLKRSYFWFLKRSKSWLIVLFCFRLLLVWANRTLRVSESRSGFVNEPCPTSSKTITVQSLEASSRTPTLQDWLHQSFSFTLWEVVKVWLILLSKLQKLVRHSSWRKNRSCGREKGDCFYWLEALQCSSPVSRTDTLPFPPSAFSQQLTLPHSRKLLPVTHVPTFQTACKMISRRCIVACSVSVKKQVFPCES